MTSTPLDTPEGKAFRKALERLLEARERERRFRTLEARGNTQADVLTAYDAARTAIRLPAPARRRTH